MEFELSPYFSKYTCTMRLWNSVYAVAKRAKCWAAALFHECSVHPGAACVQVPSAYTGAAVNVSIHHLLSELFANRPIPHPRDLLRARHLKHLPCLLMEVLPCPLSKVKSFRCWQHFSVWTQRNYFSNPTTN